jgi:hypothetical protein
MTILLVITLSSSNLKFVNSLFLAEEQVFPYKCTEADRKKDCSGSTERTVCGWFNDSVRCIRYPCAITAKSVCEACNVENVESVTDKDCDHQNDGLDAKDENNLEDDINKDNDTVDEENSIVECTEKQRNQDIMCTQDWLPVCGYKQKTACADSSKACVKNYGNNCTACKDKEVMYTRDGECPVFKGDDTTTTNDSENTEEVKYTITGKQDEDNTEYKELHFCSVDEQNVKSCDDVKNEDICGFSNCDDKDGCTKDFTNNCLACKSTDIVYTTAGKCKDIAIESVRLQYLSLTAGIANESVKSSNSKMVSFLGYLLTTILIFLSY